MNCSNTKVQSKHNYNSAINQLRILKKLYFAVTLSYTYSFAFLLAIFEFHFIPQEILERNIISPSHIFRIFLILNYLSYDFNSCMYFMFFLILMADNAISLFFSLCLFFPQKQIKCVGVFSLHSFSL